ncbi:MAG: YggS family pyridoxal phosphate-dependent enzyme [Candidatus Neomarinimicrobiota bacterium]|nr:YggS family pyridoxal phosphate-dependent enzyme [Candidatus Neomarinimicrobiota bacterium]RKY48584.1 MAG: YggS family pyridoxal phosphate-dependent enzyme [Candidatus Neomarinimicrobiota bacterium]
MTKTLEENLLRIKADIKQLSPHPDRVTLVAVTKRFPVSVMKQAVDLGIRNLGENRMQEALEKFEKEPFPGVIRHFIGVLQSNKVQKFVDHFHWLHSLDQLKTARKIHEKKSHVNICIQVNTSSEKSKSGLPPDKVQDFVRILYKETPALHIRGLMTMGPLTDDENRIRKAFRLLREIGDSLRPFETDTFSFREYSMGMSGDYRIALEEGATMLRIGQGLFGPRPENL